MLLDPTPEPWMRLFTCLTLLSLCACSGAASDDGVTQDTGTTGGDTSNPSDPPALGFGVDASSSHTCVHTGSGDLHCWGRNHVGQLGQGNNEGLGDNELPTSSLVDVGARVVQVATGNLHTCALTEDGDVKCWGLGDLGQLGYGNTDEIGLTNSPADFGPVDIGGSAVEIEAGSMYTCARLTGGDVRCWGQDFGGWLGQGTATGEVGDDELPSSIPTIDLGGAATRIAVGQVHACAILTDRSLRCWGEGPGTGHGPAATYTGDDETPAAAGDPLGEPVENVWAGGFHTCAQLVGGGLKCWGEGMDYQLGRPNPTAGMEQFGVQEVVTDASQGPEHDLGGRVIDMALGAHYSCALLETGTMKCWGQHYSGVLGKGQVGSERVATNAPDVPLGGSATGLAGQVVHNCALIGDAGDVECWGSGEFGKLGYGATTDVGYDQGITPASMGSVQYR